MAWDRWRPTRRAAAAGCVCVGVPAVAAVAVTLTVVGVPWPPTDPLALDGGLSRSLWVALAAAASGVVLAHLALAAIALVGAGAAVLADLEVTAVAVGGVVLAPLVQLQLVTIVALGVALGAVWSGLVRGADR